MMEYKGSAQNGPADKEGFSVKVLGIGGAGANALDRIALEGMDGAELVAMNTDIRALTTSVSNAKIQLGAELTKGLGAGGDPELGREAAVEAADQIRKAVKGQSIVFLCVGLGGGTGSGAAPVVARLAEQSGAFVVVFATFPFSFEGRRRLDQAQAALMELSTCANAVIVFENDRMGELILAKEGIQKAFAAADKIISQSVRAVTQIVTKTGLIHIGLDDLISALRNTDSRCLFGYGRAKGQNRAQAAVNEALKSPLLDRGQLAQANNVLVHICGGETMTLYEVELLMDELGKNLRPDAQILFGTGTDPGMGDDVGVTVISSLERSVMDLKMTIAAEAREAAAAAKPGAGSQSDPEHIRADRPDYGSSKQSKAKVKGKAPRQTDGEESDEEEADDVEFMKHDDGEDDDPSRFGGDAANGGGAAKREPTEGEEAVAMVASGKGTSQAELKLNQGARGRFEKSEPTIVDGEDLDVPTFLRDKD